MLHVLWFGGWILVNTVGTPGLPRFDPYPFQLLTTIVSTEAIFITIGVLISQNRMARQADQKLP